MLSHRARQHHREQLCDLLWQQQPYKQGKSYFRKALWQLQTALEELSQHAPANLLEVDEEWVGINPQAKLWVDIHEFEESYLTARDIRGRHLTEEQAHSLQTAVSLYRGDFLENWYQDWCVIEREHYKEIYLAIIDKLMSYAEVHEQYEAGIEYGYQILSFDHSRERTHYRLMRLKYLRGDRTGALRQFELCRQALKEELGVEPAESTLNLFELIANDLPLLEHATPAGIYSPLPPTEPGKSQRSMRQVLQRMAELQASQLKLQDDFKREMAALRELLASQP